MNAASKRQLITLATYVVAILATTVAAAQQPFDIDPSFRTNINKITVSDVLPLPDGGLIASGWIVDAGFNNTNGYVRLNSNGTRVNPYPDFTPGGGTMVAYGTDRFYVQNGQGIRRIYYDGTIDTTFDMINQDLYSTVQGGKYLVLQDSSILFSGYHQLYDTAHGFVGSNFGLIWINNKGELDTTKTPRHANGPVYAIGQLPDGKFICSGNLSTFEGMPVSRIFRTFSDGALDTTFVPPPLHYFGEAYAYAPLNNGKIVIGGFFQFDGTLDTLSLIRLLPDGQMDPNFHLLHFEFDAGPNSSTIPFSMKILELDPGRTIIGGRFNRIDGETRNGLALIDTAGNLLEEYFNGGGCGGFIADGVYRQGITEIRPTGDGSYYIIGAYHGYDDGTTNDSLQRMVTRLYGLNVGINEQNAMAPQTLQIAPNPSAGSTLLSVEAPLQNAQLTLHDASGRVALQMAWPAGSAQCQLPTGTLAPGAYVANVRTGANTRYSGRLVVLP